MRRNDFPLSILLIGFLIQICGFFLFSPSVQARAVIKGPQNESVTWIQDILASIEESDTAALVLSIPKLDQWQTKRPPDEYLEVIDHMTAALSKRLGANRDPEAVFKVMNDYLFNDLGFRAIDYQMTRSFVLSFVLDEKEGSCLGLAFLYMCLAERLGLTMDMVSLPDHVFLRYEGKGKRINIDPTLGGESLADAYYREAGRIKDDVFFQSLGKREAIATDLSQMAGLQRLNIPDGGQRKEETVDEAIHILTAAAVLGPMRPSIHQNLGVAYYERGQFKHIAPNEKKRLLALALEAFDRVVYLAPHFAPGYKLRGIARRNMGHYPEAITDFNTALDLSPAYLDVLLEMAKTYENWGRNRKALDTYRRFLRHIPPRYRGSISEVREKIAELGSLIP